MDEAAEFELRFFLAVLVVVRFIVVFLSRHQDRIVLVDWKHVLVLTRRDEWLTPMPFGARALSSTSYSLDQPEVSKGLGSVPSFEKESRADYSAKKNVVYKVGKNKDKQMLEMEESGLKNRPALPCPQGKPVPGAH